MPQLDARTIDAIRRSMEEGEPYIGSETEGILTDPSDFSVVHRVGGRQQVAAVKRWIRQQPGERDVRAAESITPDVPETTIEANPLPLHHPRSAAAAQRLLAILVDNGLHQLHEGDGPVPQLMHGAALRPPRITEDDASQDAPPFKRLYYRFQIAQHGDKVGAAAGDHLNLSAPWLGIRGHSEVSRKMIEMTARMRLVSGALSVALTASSPLYFGVTRHGHDADHRTALTPWESARLGHVWPGRTIMDVSGLYRDPVNFRRTMTAFAQTGTLLSGRDVWLMARAQPGPHDAGQPFEELCADLGIDLRSDAGLERAGALLHACFHYGPRDDENPLFHDADWRAMEAWRQEHLRRLIRAPRNRTEIRTLETPPAFGQDSPGGDWTTPYEYIKGVHSFLELLFVYLAETPEFIEDMEYGELELQAAKSNEHAVLERGIDAHIQWIPRNMHSLTARELLRRLLRALEPLIDGFDRRDDLRVVQAIADGHAEPPAARIRAEIEREYGIDAQQRHNARLLPHDAYPHLLMDRSRAALATELHQIEADLAAAPALDQPYLGGLLALVRRTRKEP